MPDVLVIAVLAVALVAAAWVNVKTMSDGRHWSTAVLGWVSYVVLLEVLAALAAAVLVGTWRVL